MRITKLLLICICCVMVAPAVWGQTENGPAKPGILGFLDPHTGAFRPVPSVAEEGPDAYALTTFTGTNTSYAYNHPQDHRPHQHHLLGAGLRA